MLDLKTFLNLTLIGMWIKLLTVPYRFLFPAIVLFCAIGVYSTNNNTFDIWMVAAFGLVGYIFILLGCEPAPLLLGFILGPMMEENLRRALLLSRGDWTVFATRPLSAGLLAAALLLIVIVLGGIYLWMPRRLRWSHVRPLVLFRGGLTPKARDFNWHNVIGVWAWIPLVLIVGSAVEMSYDWAKTLVYEATSSPAPPDGGKKKKKRTKKMTKKRNQTKILMVQKTNQRQKLRLKLHHYQRI